MFEYNKAANKKEEKFQFKIKNNNRKIDFKKSINTRSSNKLDQCTHICKKQLGFFFSDVILN